MIYEWTGEPRMVPNFGHPCKGDAIDLPEDLGASLEAQGLCKPAIVAGTEEDES